MPDTDAEHPEGQAAGKRPPPVFRTQATPRPVDANGARTDAPGHLPSETEAGRNSMDRKAGDGSVTDKAAAGKTTGAATAAGPATAGGSNASGDTPSEAPPPGSKPPKARPLTSIVPRSTIAGRALVAVVAIMTFLASLTVGAAFGVRATASQWRNDVTREVTIQLRASDARTTEAQVNAQVALAAEIAGKAPGVAGTHILSPAETARLLEPWLGSGLDLGDLPVPRVVVVRLNGADGADIAALKRTLAERVPTATLDDHRLWSHRLGAMAEGVTLAGIGLLVLVGVATVLTVVFATRAAVATNRAVVEVLHFVGARDGFIAAQFQRHFLKIGMQGGLLGGIAAAALFAILTLLPRFGLASGAQEDNTLLAWLDPGFAGFTGIAVVVVLVACATALTSRMTVYRTLRTIQ